MPDPVDMQSLLRELNEALILGVLRDGARHGYQIALDVDERSDGRFALQHGTLYPILHRLEKDGQIEGEWSAGNGRRRKEYRLTPGGRRHLDESAARLEDVFGAAVRLLGGGS